MVRVILVVCLLVMSSLARATILAEGMTFSVAGDANGGAIGDHFHSGEPGTYDYEGIGVPPYKAEVGWYDVEPVRGLSEFDLSEASAAPRVHLVFDVFNDGGLFDNNNDSFVGTILVEAYAANRAQDLSDFAIPAFRTVGSFGTGLNLGNSMAFNITGLFNEAIGRGWESLGIRLRTGLNTSAYSQAWTFDQFRLVAAVPAPGVLGLIGIGFAGFSMRQLNSKMRPLLLASRY